jgi:hypothetical protein
VSVFNVGAITTGFCALPDNPQDNAHAIFAQSVGGDGGHGGIAGAFTFGSNQTDEGVQLNAEVAIGGKGAQGATGSEVSVANTSALTTWAGQSHGILAQSVVGSGGAGGSPKRSPIRRARPTRWPSRGVAPAAAAATPGWSRSPTQAGSRPTARRIRPASWRTASAAAAAAAPRAWATKST